MNMNLKEEFYNATPAYLDPEERVEKCEQIAIRYAIEVLHDLMNQYNEADEPYPTIIGNKISELKSKLNQ